MSNTQELDFSEHMLSGEIPITQGRIPPFFGSFKGTIDLNLSHNNLSGTIPKELETPPFLENLNLSFNNFEGQLPSMSVFTNTSVISIVRNGKLCGGVPELRLLSCAIGSSKKQIHHLGTKIYSYNSLWGCLFDISNCAFGWILSEKKAKKTISTVIRGRRILEDPL